MENLKVDDRLLQLKYCSCIFEDLYNFMEVKMILFLNCSPRKNGVTSSLLRVIADQVREKDKVEWIDVNKLGIKPCIGCLQCRPDKECCLPEDDGHRIGKMITQADVLILGIPTYWGNIPGPRLPTSGNAMASILAAQTQPATQSPPRSPAIAEVFSGSLVSTKQEQSQRPAPCCGYGVYRRSLHRNRQAELSLMRNKRRLQLSQAAPGSRISGLEMIRPLRARMARPSYSTSQRLP